MTRACNLIIDTCCDLPAELVETFGVEILKFRYHMEDGDHIDNLFDEKSAREFYDSMRKGAAPVTAPPAIPMVEDAFERAVASGIPTVYLSFSSGLSGHYDAVEMARDRVLAEHPGFELYTVDSRMACHPEGLIAYEAVRQLDRGLTAKELAAWAEEARFFVNTLFMIDDMAILARGGRIPASVGFVGSKLDLKPLLTIDEMGKLAMNGMARGRKKGIKALVENYEKKADHGANGNIVIIGDADAEKEADKIQEAVEKIDPTAVIIRGKVGPVIGSHVGPGMLNLTFWGPDLRKGGSTADRIARDAKESE